MGTISGLKVAGYCGCPTCGPELRGRYAAGLSKTVYHEHRRALPADHVWRTDVDRWPEEEHDIRAVGPSPEAQLQICDLLVEKMVLSKNVGINRRSALWDLPYWRVRHLHAFMIGVVNVHVTNFGGIIIIIF